MGAVPSRETIEHWLSQPPFYGQRQQIVLIPLLKKFFPSPDCLLFEQLYEARCDPAVRYYYYANDGISKAQSTPALPVSPTAYATHESVGDVASPVYTAEVIGSTPVYCPPADVFPSVPMTREAMYDAYITNGGERMVYETDEEMLRAYRADATSVRPLPCAVAFLYHRPASEASPTSSSATWGACSEGSARAASPTRTASGSANSLLEDCTEVLGRYVKATGFVGDVRELGASCARNLSYYEMQMFLSKSAGDHHRTHVLLTAVYTYAEQWQRACLHCVPCDLTAKELAPAPQQVGNTAGKDLGDVFFYYKPFSQPHDVLAEASRTAGWHRATRAASLEGSENESGTFDLEGKAQFWAPPPLPSLFMRSRRANVPLLCFLRELRACARSFFLFQLKYRGECQDGLGSGNGDRTGVASGGEDGEDAQCPIFPIGHGAGENQLFDMSAPGSAQMWLQDVTRVAMSLTEDDGEGGSADTESMLNFHVIAPYVRALAEFIVVCLLRNINPLEVFQLSSAPVDSAMVAASAGADIKDPAAAREAPTADTVGGGASLSSSTAAAMMAASLTIPQSISVIRLPDEDMLVQSWPPSSSDEAGGDASTTTAAAAAVSPSGAGVLSAWRSRHTNYHLFWSVGPDIANRRSATAALLHWYRTEKAPVEWGYRQDVKDHEIVSGASELAQVFPSPSLESFMSTVTVNGHKEELLCCNTVLSLMPLAAGAPAAARVLRVCCLPLEELLLGELRDSCKLAREAEPEDPHWVRQGMGTRGAGGATKYVSCVLRALDSAEGAPGGMMGGRGVMLPVVPPEADGVIGDGTSCLWRVSLIERVCRIIAVAPQFLKPMRKKHSKKKKKWQPNPAVVHGTASDVFLPGASPSLTVGSPMSASPISAASAQRDEAESQKRETTPARALADAAPRRDETLALGGAKICATVAAPFPLAADVATTADASADPAKNGEKREQKVIAVAVAPASAPTRTTTGLKAVDEEASIAVATAGNATTIRKIDAVAQLQYTKGATTTSAERHLKTAEAARKVLPTTSAHNTAVAENRQSEWSPSATPMLLAATRAKAAKPTDGAPGASEAAGKPKEAKAGDTASRSSTAGATEISATATTPIHTHGATPNTENLGKAPTPPRYLHPPMPAGEHDPKRKNIRAGAVGTYRALSSASSLDGASATASPHHSPVFGHYPPPPSYNAHSLPPPLPPPPPQLLRGTCEQYRSSNGYGCQVSPLPPPSAGPHSVASGPANYGGQYSGPDGYPPYPAYGGGSKSSNSNSNGSAYYYPSMSSGTTGAAHANGRMGDGGYNDSLYMYATPSPQLQARPPPHQPQRPSRMMLSCPGEGSASVAQPSSFSSKDMSNRYEATPPAFTEASASLTPQESETCLSFGTSVSRQGTTSSFRHYVSTGAGGGLSTGAVAGDVPFSSPTEGSATLRPTRLPSGDYAATMFPMSPNTHRHSQQHTHTMASPLSLQVSDTCSLNMSPDFEDHHTASASCAGSHLHLQLDEFNSAASNGSSTFLVNGQHWHHTSHAGSSYQDGIAVTEDEGMLCGEGGGPVGGSMNVTVRVRHHHYHAHSKTASFLSDTATDATSGHHHHDPVYYMNGSTSAASCGGSAAKDASLTGRQMLHSFTSMEPSPAVSYRAVSAGADSVREHSCPTRADHHHDTSASCQHQELQPRHHAPRAAASSTRSGDTTSTARLTDKRTGTYRWDWRTAALDMGEED
ncbi:hypothetical protein LSCM4_03241 [Leishmania orientalis]|uniref:Uncharacterized protein n=1 Tax=Leishmania orientalis TaxID=2249476 RepID=A0A836GDW0_9TRYP|nr:hypothetical protein LSCM4_03241 [Leishmania orientalis]